MKKNENISREITRAFSAEEPSPETAALPQAAESESKPVISEKTAQKALGLIEANSKIGEFTVVEDIQKECGASDSELTALIQRLKENEAIVQLINGEHRYLYSRQFMVDTYAHMLVKIMNKDYLNLIVDTVRKNSKLYPRPTLAADFRIKPFNLPLQELDKIVREILDNEQFSDIEYFVGYDGYDYLNSTAYFSMDGARAMIEMWETEK